MGFVQMRLVWIGVLLLAQAAMGATVEDLLRDGHYKRAREAVQAMLAKNPNDAQARAWMAKIKIAFRDYDGGVADAEQAVKLDPKSVYAHFAWASSCAEAAGPANPIKALSLVKCLRRESDVVLSLDPNHIQTLLVQMLFYFKAPAMVGGDKAIFERVKPMLEKMGNQIYYAGPLGAGHAIKALNNYVSAAGLIAACEAMHASKAFGLDPNVAVDIINTSSGYNGTTQRKVKQFMLSGAYNAGFSTGLMAKDVRTALEIAQAMGTSTILAKPTADIWDDMEKQMGFLSDHTEMHKFTNKNK